MENVGGGGWLGDVETFQHFGNIFGHTNLAGSVIVIPDGDGA